MILVDTSVVIPYLRTADRKLAGLFRTLPVAICGITRAEILHGVRTAVERTRTIAVLNSFTPMAIIDSIWDVVGDNLSLLRSKGLIVPFTDAAIASVAIEQGIELWTRDAHFALMQNHLTSLRLFTEPP